jgi:hypothetical protein
MFKPQGIFTVRMRICKPVYDSSKKLYICELKQVASEFLYVTDTYGEPAILSKTPASFLDETLPACVKTILDQTQGWFSKPLTEAWLIEKLSYSIPTETIEKAFDGGLVFTPIHLYITKESFVVGFKLTDTKAGDKVCIDFQEAEVEPKVEVEPKSDMPPVDEQIRHETKLKVLQAREKAARALFKAEELMHSYVQKYGTDTDWEDEE